MPEGGVLFEGDMILPRSMVKQAIEEGTMVNNGDGDPELEIETITEPLFMRWTNGIIPYVVHKDLSKLIHALILHCERINCFAI